MYLHVISPATSQLASGLSALNSSVHRQNPLIAEELGDKLAIGTKNVVMECTRRESEQLALSPHGVEDLRVAVALVDRRICRQEIVVLLAIDIPNLASFALCQNHLVLKG